VCTIAWWPGKIPARTASDAITSMMDILPTFARLAGTQAPTDRKIDGVDLWPVLTGEPAKPPREAFHYFRGLLLEAVRSGPWKLHLASGELFHLGSDIGEAKNVAATNAEVVKRLRGIAEAMNGDLGVDGIGPGCRALGRVEHPQPIMTADGTVRREMAGAKAAFP
jgi:arylsulfatase A